MDYLRDHRSSLDAAEHPGPPLAPGRATLTSRLARRASGTDPAIAPAAETAVAAAATDSGQPLPAQVQRQFEGSLGADLSGVRVHTGPASAAASQAVGAQAYATGDDIHFAAGKFAPDDPFGLHLLAHEVAHTVQQRGGPPQRQDRLDVSGPADAAEHEADRAADAMVQGAPATVTAAAPTVARKDEPAPYVGPTPDNVFDLDHLPPATRAQIDQLTLDKLRPLVQSHVVASYVAYTQASGFVAQQIKAKKEARQAEEKRTIELLMGAVGMMLGAAGPSVSTALAGAQGQITASISSSVGTVLSGMGAEAGFAAHGANAANAIATAQVAKLVAKVTPEKASGWIATAASKVGAVMGTLSITNDSEDIAASYVDAMLLAADKSQAALLDSCAASNDAEGLLAAYAHFSGGNLARYRVEIETKANHFLEQIAPTLNPSRGDTLARIDAYGKPRLARVKINLNPGLTGNASDNRHTFYSWITPDMEALALAANPNPRVLPAAAMNGLVDPVADGEHLNVDKIVRIDAWGRPRLAIVVADHSTWSAAATGTYTFKTWISDRDDEQTAARIRGESQIGGITDLDPGRVTRLPAPPSK